VSHPFVRYWRRVGASKSFTIWQWAAIGRVSMYAQREYAPNRLRWMPHPLRGFCAKGGRSLPHPQFSIHETSVRARLERFARRDRREHGLRSRAVKAQKKIPSLRRRPGAPDARFAWRGVDPRAAKRSATKEDSQPSLTDSCFSMPRCPDDPISRLHRSYFWPL